MTDKFVISNVGITVETMLSEIADRSDRIELAVAFVSSAEPVQTWLNRGKSVKLLVALMPPTDSKVLRSLVDSFPAKLDAKYYKCKFHSKLFIFFRGNKAIGALVGSSNLTGGGLRGNLETNVILREPQKLSELAAHFKAAWRDPSARALHHEVLDRYQMFCDRTAGERNALREKDKEFQWSGMQPHLKTVKAAPAASQNEARNYLKFKDRVDDLIKIVEDVSNREWPSIRHYLTVDQFWHWLVKENWDEGGIAAQLRADPKFRNERLPGLFARYARWDKEGNNVTSGREQETSAYLQEVLAKKKLPELTEEVARNVYGLLHAGYFRTNWLKADEKFVTDNPIAHIRRAFDYLLWSDDEVEDRILALLPGGRYRLAEFGSSSVQELLGWVRPEMPIRNDKADKAVEDVLGIHFR